MAIFRKKRGDPLASYGGVSALDRSTLDLLVARGADLSKPRQVRHFLYVHSATHQAEAATEARAAGWSVEQPPQVPARPNDWLVLAQRDDITLDAENVMTARETFESLSRRFNGKYEGWETAV